MSHTGTKHDTLTRENLKESHKNAAKKKSKSVASTSSGNGRKTKHKISKDPTQSSANEVAGKTDSLECLTNSQYPRSPRDPSRHRSKEKKSKTHKRSHSKPKEVHHRNKVSLKFENYDIDKPNWVDGKPSTNNLRKSPSAPLIPDNAPNLSIAITPCSSSSAISTPVHKAKILTPNLSMTSSVGLGRLFDTVSTSSIDTNPGNRGTGDSTPIFTIGSTEISRCASHLGHPMTRPYSAGHSTLQAPAADYRSRSTPSTPNFSTLQAPAADYRSRSTPSTPIKISIFRSSPTTPRRSDLGRSDSPPYVLSPTPERVNAVELNTIEREDDTKVDMMCRLPLATLCGTEGPEEKEIDDQNCRSKFGLCLVFICFILFLWYLCVAYKSFLDKALSFDYFGQLTSKDSIQEFVIHIHAGD